jgi:ABC-type amino acid transport substrate-binding protein
LGFCVLAVLILPETDAQTEVYTVGVERIDYRPILGYRAGVCVGILPELLDAFAAEQGIRFDYRPLPVARLLSSFLNGQLDFKLPDHPAWQSDRRAGVQIHYSRPLLAFTDGTLVKPEHLGRGREAITSLATVIGFTPSAWQPQIAAGQVRLRESLDLPALMRQTIAGRVDAAYANIQVAAYQLEQHLAQPGALVFDPGLPHVRDHYHLATLKHPHVLLALDRWLPDWRLDEGGESTD